MIAGSKRLLECSFLIPTRRDPNLSDGESHSRKAWSWLRKQLHKFGGATRSKELYEGWYIDPDTDEEVKDLSRKYFVALPKQEVGDLRSMLQGACKVFRQKYIYLSIAGQVEFVENPHDEPK